MPDSMFGRPSQHLLPSYPPANAGGSSVASDTAPVQPTPVSFKDFRFNSIGKQPELLSRISLPQPDHTGYHSSTPSPASTPPPPFTNDSVLQSKSFSRPTLFQQLAGSDFSSSMDEGLRWNPSTSQSNRSLASRIQMNGSPSNDAVNTVPSTASGFPSPASRVNTVRRAAEGASLIPPVEFLPQPPESSPTTPTSASAPALEAVDVHSPTSSTLLMNTTTRSSRIPTPTVSTTVTSGEPTMPFPSFAVVDAMMQDLQPSQSTAAAIDSLVGRQERLHAISANLANLASPLPPLSSQSSSPDTFFVSRANDNVTPHQSSQPQNSSTPIALHYPYSANQSSGQVGLIIDDIPPNTDDSSLALVHSPTTITQEHQARHKAVIEAIQNLNSTLSAAHRAQIDSENALAFQIRTFEEQRAAFEKTKRAQEATLHHEFQELQQKREELNAKEASLASLEQESKAREVARKAVLAKRQAQEEEKRAAEAKRTQEVQEQIAAAMTELKEIEVLKAKGRLEQLASETVPGDLPTEPHESMDEEEIVVIKSRNDLLRAAKHLRRMHSDKVQKLQESNHTLRRLEDERCRRLAEELHLRMHAEAERARQVLDEKRRQLEAERKRQEVENDRERARLSVEQQAHAEAQAHGSRRTEATSNETHKHRSHPEEVNASQQQDPADMTRIRAAPEANFLSPEVTTAMNADEDGKAFASHRAVPLPDIHTNSGGSQNATSQSKQKKDKPISGSMLNTPTLRAIAGLPPKPSARPPSLSTSDHVAENALKSARTSPACIVSTEGRRGLSFPAQFASEFNRVVDAEIRRTPDRKPAFPRTPKSQTLLDATIGGNEEVHIGPVTGFSPTQQNVNLRHLKRNRSRIDENDSGDRSVRTNVKSEENTCVSVKREEHDDQSREFVQASLSTNPLASLPPRPAIIPPPRPRKRHAAPALQTHSISSHPPESNGLSSTKGEAQITTDEQPREALSRGSPSSQAMNASVQLPVPTETTNSLLLRPVYPESQPPELRINVGERATQDRSENYDTTSSEPASATLSHELDGEDPSRSNRRSTDEHHRARNGNKFRRLSDRYSPSSATSWAPATSPTSHHRYIDRAPRRQNPSNGPRAETVRDISPWSPTTGRNRPFELHNNEHSHRARRQRDDVWIAEGHDRDRVDSYRSPWEPDERRAGYRAPTSPSDRVWSYPYEIPRETNDNRTYIPPFSEEPTAQAARWEPSHRRSENDETYQRYQPSAPGYDAVTDLHHADDVRVNQTYEPMTEERIDIQPDPSLLTRMSDTQHFPPSTNLRGRGRGEPNRGRGDFGRGRGRGVTRGTPALLERLKPGPSLGDRLS